MKASFEFSIEIPDDQIALCNTPEKETTASSRPGGSKDYKWKVIKFEKSPVMSTYLYTWAFGDFGYVEAETEREYNGKRLPVRVYATKGLEEQGRYALEHARKFIDLLSEVSTSGQVLQEHNANHLSRYSKSYLILLLVHMKYV
jgi:aminopeptidase N